MTHEGPTLELLLRRLAETPSEFLAAPHTGNARGLIHVPAVVSDLFTAHGHADAFCSTSFASPDAFTPEDTLAAKRRASLTLVLCWLIAEPELISANPSSEHLHTLLAEGAADLAAQFTAEKYLAEPERREELARFALAQLDLRPHGESVSQAQDRLSALSSAERARVIKASRLAEHRARQVREALARKAAQESADKYTRE